VTLSPTLNGKTIPAGYILNGTGWCDGKVVSRKKVPAEKGFTTTLTIDVPGWTYMGFSLSDAKNPQKKVVLSGRNYRGSGIIVEPEKLRPGRPEPADFDKFWNANKAELAKVPLKVLEKKKIPVRKGFEKYAETFQLKGHLGDLISSYSHGMRQKLVLISALVHNPKLLILDEPFVGLDPIASFRLKELMRELCANGSAIFFSTHVLEVAEKLCDRVGIIKQGKLVKEGTMQEIAGDKSLESLFLEIADE
jgi:hypothetical protein